MANILIVEDDEFFRSALKSTVEGAGHKVEEAPNGRVARDMIKMRDYDAVLSDVQMPFLDGIELLEWVKTEKPTKFILMTGFSHLLETQTAFEIGADDFLSKPFSNSDLVTMLKKYCPIVDLQEPQQDRAKQKEEDLDSEFCKVSIEEFVATKALGYDVFIRLSPYKFVKIGHKQDVIPLDRIRLYKSKGLKYLHIRKEDFQKHVNFTLVLSKVVSGRDDVSREKKMNFMRYTGELILEKAYVSGVDEDAFENAKEFMNTTVNVLGDNRQALDLLNYLNTHADFLYAHALCVSMYSVMIARRMGWQSSQSFFKLSMAGLYHDIGKKEIDREILEKPRPLLTQKERSILESHATRGKEILAALKFMPSEVVRVAYEHHEDILGQGYPRGLKKHEIHPFTLVISTANLFADYAIKTPYHEGMSGREAIEQMVEFDTDRLDRKAFAALRSIFNME